MQVKHNRVLSVLLFGNDAFSTIVLDAVHLNSLNRCKYSYQRIVDKVEIVYSGFKNSKKSSSVLKYARNNGLVAHNYNDYSDMIPSNREFCDLRGAINVHPSLLPRWRGASPIQFALLHGDNVTGVTIADVLPDKYDRGRILMQESLKINDRETYIQLHNRLADLSSNLLLRALLDLANLHRKAQKQNERNVTYASKINQNMDWINWSEHSNKFINRMWRALGYQKGLKTTWRGTVVKLIDFCYLENYEANLSDINHTNMKHGFVKYDEDLNAIIIKCKDGLVAFRKVQFACRKVITALDFYNAYLTRIEESKRYFGAPGNRPT
ncbi:Methionyl-tRNA formyltransferase, mitochondrial [Trichoplax sp. H2]|nr:Methionyl-tRNA formyltransferase, mitochondrial [Trichoplax sp. H2]|eukprot:RDD39796.1 Methionyl-tRNA formyltransferase, mitochondrial [Trichoplax sp. H2]